jgi:hypothetical protein
VFDCFRNDSITIKQFRAREKAKERARVKVRVRFIFTIFYQ